MKAVFVIYILCFLFRAVEYMIIRTDQSILGEAVLHKLTGILILAVSLNYFSLRWQDIGFTKRESGLYILYGLLLGVAVFALAYGAEWIVQSAAGKSPVFDVYVSSYALTENRGRQAGLTFFAVCIAGNIINVLMEEGVFRGLFLKLLGIKYPFWKAVVISSLLFGVWHIAAPLRGFLDGDISAGGAAMAALTLVLAAGLTGAKCCLLARLTGSLWMPMADHFVNNTIVNLLHVVTVSGADEWMSLRITIAQTVSFIFVLTLYLWKKKHIYISSGPVI